MRKYTMPKWIAETNGLHRMTRLFYGNNASGSFNVIIVNGVIREPVFTPNGKRLARKKVRALIPNYRTPGMHVAESKRRDQRDRFVPAVIEALGSDTGTLNIYMMKGGIVKVRPV